MWKQYQAQLCEGYLISRISTEFDEQSTVFGGQDAANADHSRRSKCVSRMEIGWMELIMGRSQFYGHTSLF